MEFLIELFVVCATSAVAVDVVCRRLASRGCRPTYWTAVWAATLSSLFWVLVIAHIGAESQRLDPLSRGFWREPDLTEQILRLLVAVGVYAAFSLLPALFVVSDHRKKVKV